MGWQSSSNTLLIITALTGGFSGVFVYSPAPGSGNLIASIAATAGTDPYGNAYQAGITSYTSAGTLWAQLFNNNLNFNDSSTIGSISGQLKLTPGTNLSNFLQLQSADIWVGSPLVANVGNAPETWHTLTPGNSWTGTFNYRLGIENQVFLSFNLTAPGAGVNNVTIVTLPAGYRPTTTRTFPISASAANAGSMPLMTITSAGVAQVQDVVANAVNVAAEMQFPLGI